MRELASVIVWVVAARLLTSSAVALAEDINCHPAGVGENYGERFVVNGQQVGAVAVQCKEAVGAAFFVARSDEQAAARFTSIALAALLSGKRLHLSYEPTSICGEGRQCFLLYQWSLWTTP